MNVCIAVSDPSLSKELVKITQGLNCSFTSIDQALSAQIIVADEASARDALASFTGEHRPTIFVTVAESAQELPQLYLLGLADDVLVTPVRRNEFLSRLRWHYHLQNLRELEHTTAGVPALVKKLEEDLRLAEKIQRRLIRDKFPPMQGVSVKSKYWCGMQSGGDYFDVIEFPGGRYVGFLMADASSYTLSANLLATLMRQSLQVPQGEEPTPEKMIASVLNEVTMKEKDRLAIFFGVLDRKTYRMRYVSEGSIWACKRSGSGSQQTAVEWIMRGERKPLSATVRVVAPAREVRLDPEDRLLLFSDGWSQSIGSTMPGLIETQLKSEMDPQALVNELSFQLKQSIHDPEDDEPMPPRDCSVLLVDIEKNILRLA